MAQQIKIDIIAETQKLTQGVNNVNGELNNLTGGIGKAQQAAVGLASAFVLKEGISFLKKASEEALDAEKTGKAAAAAFGEGSTALQKVTSDAEKFAKELAIDNDEIIKLATGLGVRLPKDAQGSSAELVLLAKNLEAASAGAISAESVIGKLGKAFADGEVTAKELSKAVPGLDEATYKYAETLSKSGKNQEAMNVLIEAGQQKFGGAAADQVTGAQRIDKAMGDLYETIGEKVAPIVEKLSEKIAEVIDWMVQNKDVVIPLAAILGTLGGIILAANVALTVYNGLLAAKKVATGLATAAQWLFNAAMSANPIGLVILAIAAIIAIIVLLVKNWDTVTEVVGKVWEAIKNFGINAWNAIKDFASKAWESIKEFASNFWNKIKETVENVIGKFTGLKDKISEIWGNIKDKIAELIGNIVDKIKEVPKKMLSIGEDIVRGLWNGIQNMADWIKDKIGNLFGSVIGIAKKALGIKSPSKIFAGIGKNIATGLWTGLNGQKTYLKNNFNDFFGDIIPALTLDSLNLPDFNNFATLDYVADAVSNASVEQSAYAGVGIDWNAGTEQFDIDSTVVTTSNLKDLINANYSIPSLNGISNSLPTYTITINAGAGSDPYSIGRIVKQALDKYGTIAK